jgi:hypothetical protein
MVMIHMLHITVVGHKSKGVLTKGLLVQDWPVFQIFPGSSVAPATTYYPLFTIIRYPCGGAMQYVGQSLFLPTLPPLGAPLLSLERLFY